MASQHFKEEFKKVMKAARRNIFDQATVQFLVDFSDDSLTLASKVYTEVANHVQFKNQNDENKIVMRIPANNYFLSYDRLRAMIKQRVEEKKGYLEAEKEIEKIMEE